MEKSIYEILRDHGHSIIHDYLESKKQGQIAEEDGSKEDPRMANANPVELDKTESKGKGKVSLDGKGNVTIPDETLGLLVQDLIEMAKDPKKHNDSNIRGILLKYLNSSTVTAQINKSKKST